MNSNWNGPLGRVSRRQFLGAGAVLPAALAMRVGFAEELKPVRIGLVGVGNRGTSLVKNLVERVAGVEIPALCDINPDNLARAQKMVVDAGRREPEGYSRGPEDYRRLCDRNDLDAVIVATPWEFHAPVMVAAMKGGKYGATEVPAAVTLEECWQLVETSEATGKPCMLLENVNYFKESLMVLNMIRQGLFGEMLHCEAGYRHDVRGGKVDRTTGEIKWRGQHSVARNENLYPTHPIGPIAWWLDINRGDRFSYLVSMSTFSRGINVFVEDLFGKEHPNAGRKYALGDVNTSLIRTERGKTITLYHDTQSYRPYDLMLCAQGTRGVHYSDGEEGGTSKRIYIHGRSPERRGRPQFETGADYEHYLEEFKHPLWKHYEQKAEGSGHGGGDYMELDQFVKAVRTGQQTPVDVYDAATWSVISALSGKSVADKSMPMDFPDFTKGRWKEARQIEFWM